MKVQAIILNAGSGTRMKAALPKTLIPFLGQPLFLHAVRRFEDDPDVESLLLICGQGYLETFERAARDAGCRKVKHIIAGGERRSDSVANGLARLDSDTTHVVVHDGARPYFSQEAFAVGLAAVRENPAVILAVPVKPTIKEVDPRTFLVRSTLTRDALWEAQTPQIFQKEVLIRAHAQDKSDNPTDDAVLVERLGLAVRVIPGDYRNIKLTTPEDWPLAEQLLKEHQ